ncbi:MAG: hypothetical protein K2L96_08930 [Muribaculaceae bacterium]|nr:hypothetical protein [Muribaculaceae bacterium]
MKIALITLHTPTETNFRGASALPFHLIAFRPQSIELEIWSYNINECNKAQIVETENALGLKIHLIGIPKWFKTLKSAFIRLILSKPILYYLPLPKNTINEIKSYLHNDKPALWIYGEDIAHISNHFEGLPIVITTPDCEAMYYHRVLAMKGIPQNIISTARYALMYHRYAKTSAYAPSSNNITYHLVGKEDTRFLENLNPTVKAVYLPHPHYTPTLLPKAELKKHERIRLLIAGRYDFTMALASDDAVKALSVLPQEIKDRYHITFLGQGWDICLKKIKEAGFTAEHKTFVKEYAEEIASHHIQLTPISVGTGTKGKVLDAFINGLLVIGTPLALENIEAKHGEECVKYINSDELSQWLTHFAIDPMSINKIAKAGQMAVLREHSREKIASELFKLFEYHS